MIRRQINQHDLANDPYSGWNEFVDLIAIEAYEDLSVLQRPAHLVFWYDAEVNNGGHLQYFLNSAGERASETLRILLEQGLPHQHSLLEAALEIANSVLLSEIDTVEDSIAEAAEERFAQLDLRYYEHQYEVTTFLEKYLDDHFNDFIELT